MKINNFALIIGAVKCGTTSLFNYLAEHPQIAASLKKETHFFSNSLYFARGFEYYQSLWDWNPTVHQIALEATPNYTRMTDSSLANTVENITKLQSTTNIDFKFIYIMRDPIERIESHYTHIEAWGQEPTKKPFSQGIDNEIIDVSKYAMQIDEYYKRFPHNNILLLNFEDLKTDTLNVVRKVCRFLDVDPNYEFQRLSSIYNDHKERKIITLPGWRLLRKTELMQSIVRLVPSEARQAFSNIFGKKIESYVKLSPEQRDYVLRELKADLRKLNIEYGVDVSRWGIEV
jgi:hypothetical protein